MVVSHDAKGSVCLRAACFLLARHVNNFYVHIMLVFLCLLRLSMFLGALSQKHVFVFSFEVFLPVPGRVPNVQSYGTQEKARLLLRTAVGGCLCDLCLVATLKTLRGVFTQWSSGHIKPFCKS